MGGEVVSKSGATGERQGELRADFTHLVLTRLVSQGLVFLTLMDILFRLDTMLLPFQELINAWTGVAEVRRGRSRKRKITKSFPCTSYKLKTWSAWRISRV
jgi:hypothetical protein